MEKHLRGKTTAIFVCMVTLSLLLWLGMQKANAATCGYPNGPKTGTMIADVNEWKACGTMASLTPPGEFWMTLSNMPAGSQLANGLYGSYCVDLTGTILDNPQEGNVEYKVNFWSSMDPNLPTAVKQVTKNNITYTIPWDKINYLLNKYPNASWLDLQAAYWDLVHNCTAPLLTDNQNLFQCRPLRPAPYYFPFGPSAPYGCGDNAVNEDLVKSMVTDANANGNGFVPQAGQQIATVGQITNCTPDTICSQNMPYQIFFIPSTCPTCTGSIGDFVWMDKNGNGVQDAGEPGISGVVVNLTGTDDNNQPVSLSTTTDKDGKYQFSNLCASKTKYTVTVVKPSGFDPTINLKSDGDYTVISDSTDSNDPAGTTVTITTDTSSNPHVDFGFVPHCAGSIGDLVWQDLDSNGKQDIGEPVIASNVLVSLSGLDTYGNSISKTTTTSGGSYSFDGLCQGTYEVKVVSGIPAGFYPTSPLNNSGDSPARIPDDSNDPSGTNVTLTSDTDTNPTVDFGYTPKCSGKIGDYIWRDMNENGVQDSGDLAIDENVEVSLSGTNVYGQLVSMTTKTDINGFYQFDGLCQSGAKGYTVKVNPSTVPAGWVPTSPLNADGTNPPGVANDSNNPNGTVVHLAADNEDNPTVDFGYIPDCKATIGNFVWEDKDGNGIQDELKTGIDNVKIQITGTNFYGQSVNESTLTADGGFYLFTGICKGNYTVSAANPPGMKPTSPVSSNGNDGVGDDSNNPVGTSVILSDNSTPNETVDFGYIKPVSIGDRVWEDKNNNGLQDDGATGLNGWTVTLTKPDNSTVTFTTAGDGIYDFSNLAPGTYKVCTTPMTGFTQTYDLVAPLDNCATITLNSGDNRTDVDFGYVMMPATIGNFVWDDTNRNGVQDDGEQGIQGAKVDLFDCTGKFIATTNTNANGLYSFSVAPGDYYVKFYLASGYTDFSPRDQGNDTKDSDAYPVFEPDYGRTICTTLTSGENDTSWDAGMFSLAPDLMIKKYTNGEDADTPTGPMIPVGDQVTWTYIVSNTGNVPLDVKVTDDKLGAITCPKSVLVSQESMTCTATGIAQLGQYKNVGCVESSICSQVGCIQLTKCDPSHYFGVKPSIDIRKQAEGPDSRTFPAGSSVPFEIAVTNTSDVILTNVMVTDAQVPGCANNIGTLNPGQTVTYTCNATNVMKSFTNTACTEAMYGTTKVTDCDDSSVKVPSIDIRKQAEGPDSRTFPAGSSVPFEIAVTNTSDVILTNVMVTDAQVPGCANNIGTLNPGQTVTYTCNATNVMKSFTNTACVNAQYAATPVSDCDDSTVVVPSIDIIKYVSPDGINWFHTDQNNILKIALCQTCEEDYDKDHCDYDRDGKCDEKDVDYCKYNKYNCDKHDSEHGSSKRKHRCDDSSNKSYCDDKARDAHERDHGDYNNDGKCDERDVDYCSSNKSTCDRHDSDRRSIKRNFRCDDSSSKTWCENKKKDAEESDKDRSDYNRDGKCDERDVDYCKNSKYSCDQFDKDRNNLKRRFRCDDSSNSGLCEEKAREEHEKDDSDYNRDGKCDERDIDYCRSNRSSCDQHDKNHGNSKRSHKCDDSSDKSTCEGKARQEHDKDRGDYNRDGKHDERDIDFCNNNKDLCVKHDRDHNNCKRSYRCDDSYNKSTCEGYAQREHDKDKSDYNHDGKCDEKDIEHCKGDQGRCDKHDKDRGQSKRTYRCDDSYNKSTCDANAQREHDKDRSDYNRDGKRDERDIEFCKGEEEECIKHDKGHGNFKRSYRCDESSNKTSCESTRYSEDKSDRDRSDYNRDGKCDERDISYCKYNSSACNTFDSERGNKKRTYRCDNSYDRSSCESKANYEHERDHGDYNRDGKCDERDIDLCKNSPYGCDDHDRKHGDSKRNYRCEDSSDRTRCESQSKEEYDHESSCSGSGGTPPVTCGKVYFKFVTTNVGSEPLTNLTLADSVYSLNSCVKPASLPAGGSYDCKIGPLPALVGQHVNTATATGMSGTVKVEDMDKGYYYGCDGSAAKSPGYWKNHPEAWPVDSIVIGGKTYTKAQAISLMSTSVSGDKTYTLFKALVAAKLDAMGCGDSTCVMATIASSDAWMALHPVGSGVAGDSSAWKQAEPWYLILDDYINGKLQCGGGDVCTPPPPPAPTCGQCSGGVSKLTLKYTGYSNATVTVKDSSDQVLFNGTVSAYSSFSFNSKVAGSSMGQYVKIYVNGSYKVTIYTDCSKTIYPGMGVGSFTVVEGYSLNGGKFCRVSSSSCTSDDDHHYSKDYCDSHDGESSCSSIFSFDKESDYSSWGSWSSHDD